CPSSQPGLVHSPRPIDCANRDDKPEHHVKAVGMFADRCNEQQHCAEHRQNYFQDSSTAHDRSPIDRDFHFGFEVAASIRSCTALSLSPTAAEFAVIFAVPDSCWPIT